MQKMALVFVNGMEKDIAKTIQLCTKASLGAHAKKPKGIFSKKSDFETVVVQVLDIQNLIAIKYNVEKFGINHFFATNDNTNPDPMQSVLAIGPEESDKLNKISAGLRLF